MSPLTKSKPEHPYKYTGFGFEFADLDGDGDQDLVLANNDFDTPHSEVGIFWYENPGIASAQLRSPWAEHTINKINLNDPTDPLRELYTKAQVAIGDLDRDGQIELVLQTRNQFLIYDKPAKWLQCAIRQLQPDPCDQMGVGNADAHYPTRFW